MNEYPGRIIHPRCSVGESPERLNVVLRISMARTAGWGAREWGGGGIHQTAGILTPQKSNAKQKRNVATDVL
jgi:hypothetical protein